MSLIPNESYSFPDDFSRAISRARALDQAKRLAAANKNQAPPVRANKRTADRARQPEPVPVAQENRPAPERPLTSPAKITPAANTMPPVANDRPVAAPQKLQASTPPENGTIQTRAPIPRKVPVHRNQATAAGPLAPAARPAGPKRFGPVRLPKSVRIPADLIVSSSAPQPMKTMPNENLVPGPAIAAPDFEEETTLPPAAVGPISLRRRKKVLRFVLFEAFALVLLVPAALLALSHRVEQPVFLAVTNIVTIVAAAAVAILPIVFFAVPSKLPRP